MARIKKDRRYQYGTDEDGHCKRCGIKEPPIEETVKKHKCPPGFLIKDTPNFPPLYYVKSHWATIYVGRRPGYQNVIQYDLDFVRQLLSTWIEAHKVAVTLTETEFFYPGGSEKGAMIGLINYPRHPKTLGELKTEAIKLASFLREKLGQTRVSVVTPDEIVMVGPMDEDKKGTLT